MSKNIIYLTYSPSRDEKERICGHTFEVMDYYLFLKDLGYEAKILILDKFKNKEKLFKAWEDKYYIDFNYKKDIEFKNINFDKKNILLLSGILIITSGIDEFWNKIIDAKAKKIISFQCQEFDYSYFLSKSNFYLLRDERLYQNKNYSSQTFQYIKKIYFKRYKKFEKDSEKKSLIYINSKLKDLEERKLQKLKETSEYALLFISGTQLTENQIKKYKKYGELLFAPINNLWNKFEEFIYTPNTRNFDCSPRFVTECKFYNKKIKITFNLKNDKGAYYRYNDLKNFDKLILKEGDLIEKFIL
jgi:hypothetical protein